MKPFRSGPCFAAASASTKQEHTPFAGRRFLLGAGKKLPIVADRLLDIGREFVELAFSSDCAFFWRQLGEPLGPELNRLTRCMRRQGQLAAR